jgi:hypothetical protein
MANYRPISLLTIFSKVFETAMHSSLSHRLHTNNILVKEQYDFSKGISTENPAFRLKDNVFKFINKKCWGIFCDLANDVDFVNHEMLLVGLHFYGIQGVSADCFRSCFTNRRHTLDVNSPNKTKNFFLTEAH